MALKRGDRANFKTLLRAARANALALVESTDAETGEYRALICAIVFDGQDYCITPFGHLATADPFEQYTDPSVALDDAERGA